MNNELKYKKAFAEGLSISEDIAKEGLQYNTIPDWDSVGHMQLIVALEDAFDIMIDTEDVIDLSSYEKGKEILKKYDIAF